MGCVVSLALVATAAALTPAEVVRTICPHCDSHCSLPQPLAAAPPAPAPAPASNATTVDGAQHARRCELETGICATFQAGLWDLLRDHWPRGEQLVVADVGANKGFFSSRALAVFAPRCGVDPNLVRSAVCAYLKARDLAEEAEGSCNTGYDGAPLPTDGAPCGLDTVVHSFEPSPPLYRMATALQRAVFPETLPAWRWHGAALSDYEGSSTFHALWNEGSYLRQRVRGSGRRLTENATSVVVNVTTLDAWTARHGVERIGLLKIDAEGHDLAVVDGATVTACDPVKPNWDVDPSVYTHGCKQTRVTHGTNGESAPDDVLERVLAALAAPDEATRLAACACCDSKGARCDEF